MPNSAKQSCPSAQLITSEFLRAIKQVESGGRADAISPKGAEGAMQIMPTTSTWLNQTRAEQGKEPLNPWEPTQALQLAKYYLSNHIACALDRNDARYTPTPKSKKIDLVAAQIGVANLSPELQERYQAVSAKYDLATERRLSSVAVAMRREEIAAAYNAGPQRVLTTLPEHLPTETQQYIERIRRARAQGALAEADHPPLQVALGGADQIPQKKNHGRL